MNLRYNKIKIFFLRRRKRKKKLKLSRRNRNSSCNSKKNYKKLTSVIKKFKRHSSIKLSPNSSPWNKKIKFQFYQIYMKITYEISIRVPRTNFTSGSTKKRQQKPKQQTSLSKKLKMIIKSMRLMMMTISCN